MTKQRYSLGRSLLSLCIVLLILQGACAQPVPPEATTPAPDLTTEAPAESPTPTAPESTTETPAETLTPTATASTPESTEEFIPPVVSTERQDCFFWEGTNTTPAAAEGVPEGYYVPNQIIFSGDPTAISFIVSDPDSPFTNVIEDKPIDPLPGQFSEVLLGIGGDVQLYSTSPGEPILDLVREINQLATDNGLRVLAEPNYVTRLPAGVTVGNPGGDGGSGIHGDPNKASQPVPAQGYDQFIRQWAFSGPTSIRLFDDNNPHNWTPGPLTGAGVRVVVFDTTPLPEGDHLILPKVAPFHLCVWQPGLRFAGTIVPDPADTLVRIPKEEHGLFVSGMAHGLAPASEYYLIEVLDNAARGDVYTLVRAIALYLTHPVANPSQMRTVFNLSLGLQVLHEEDIDEEVDQVVDISWNNIQKNFSGSQTLMELLGTFPVPSLKLALAVAEGQYGVVVVASAGNDGISRQQVPASFEPVLGVASTNIDAAETCFSNLGDLSAPSGDSFEDLDNDGTKECVEDIPFLCKNTATCALSAVVSNVTQSGIAPSGFAYWTGTSFSAPMASGLAALILEMNNALMPVEVRDAIMCGVTPASSLPAPRDTLDRRGKGLINVDFTLNSSCVPLSPTPTPTP